MKLFRKRPFPQKKSWLSRLFFWGAILTLMGIACAAFTLLVLYAHYNADLPQISSLKDYRPPIVTTIYSDDGRVIAELFKERRIVTPLKDVPKTLIQAFISAEDSRFFEHPGVDMLSILRAAVRNVEAGAMVQGGSTITQQVTKSFLLSPEKTFRRKIREAILAYRIDRSFSKEDILYLYLNQIYLGHGAYGVGAAADNYFGKSVQELNIAECALLAGMPQAPSRSSPFHHFDKARERQKYVLTRMAEEGYITQQQADEAFATPLKIQKRQNIYLEQVPDYTEHIRRYLVERYGEDRVLTDGLQVHTAVNIEMQKAAKQAVLKGLRDLDKRHHAYRGAVRHLAEVEAEPFRQTLAAAWEASPPDAGDIVQGVVTRVDAETKEVGVRLGGGEGAIPFSALDWAIRKTKGKAAADRIAKILSPGDVVQVALKSRKDASGQWDLSLEQDPMAQSALLCLEAGTGYAKAMVGGRDFRENQFNRAVQSRRQPGSAFKPLIYAAALDKGYTPASEIVDNVFIYTGGNTTWKPKNYDRKFQGRILLRKALAESRNLSTINLLNEIGVDYVADYVKKLGVTSEISRNLSTALGSSGVSLLELSAAYSVFANNGNLVQPVFVTRILDRDGKELETAAVVSEPAIDARTAYLMTSLLQSVITEGTGKQALALNRPAAGKTGTTNNLNDAWFMGYTADFIAGVWVGYDEEQSLGGGESGARAALPTWLDFMQAIHADRPVKGFSPPPGIVYSKIDADTGLLPVSESRHTIFECFKEGTVPQRYSRSASSVVDPDQFYKADM